MERSAGLAHDDTPQGKLDKLDAMLAQRSTSRQDAVLFAEMLSLPNDGRIPRLDLPHSSAGSERWKLWTTEPAALKRATGADDLRGCALGRSERVLRH